MAMRRAPYHSGITNPYPGTTRSSQKSEETGQSRLVNRKFSILIFCIIGSVERVLHPLICKIRDKLLRN